MLTLTCPTSQQLSDFEAGKLSLEELNVVAVHLEACPACQTVLEGMDAQDDTLMSELKQAQGEDEYAGEAGCQRAVAKVEAVFNLPDLAEETVVIEPAPEQPPSPWTTAVVLAGVWLFGDGLSLAP